MKPNLWRGNAVRLIHVMAKPTGPMCNLGCSYGYYLSKQVLLTTENRWHMTDEVLEAFIQQYFQGQNYKAVVFSWQGGEPTLLGVDFFRKVVELQKRYCPPHVRCENDLQTKGTLLNEAWCEFLGEHHFLVGLTLDGPKELQDRYRKDKAGLGSFDEVFQAARLLRKNRINFATLSCVNRVTAKEPFKVYRFLRDEVGSQRLQFIPIVEPVGFWYKAQQYRDPRPLHLLLAENILDYLLEHLQEQRR